MGKTTVTRFKWFWAWQDEREEAWLGAMSAKGYHFTSPKFPGIYRLSQGEPRDYVYRLDYHAFSKKDKEEYLQLFRDAGWEHLGELSGWQYFRKERKPGEVNEIFTDVESKIAKYKRILAFLSLYYFVLVIILAERIHGEYSIPWWGGIQVIALVLLLLFTCAVIRLAVRIRELKKR